MSTIIVAAILMFVLSWGCPGNVAPWLRTLSILALAVSIPYAYIQYRSEEQKKEEERKSHEPRRCEYNSSQRYEKAMEEWRQKKAAEKGVERRKDLLSSSLEVRLKARNENRKPCNIRDDNHANCLVCGYDVALSDYDNLLCEKCLRAYDNTPKVPLPKGVSEKYRKLFWAYQHAIAEDLRLHRIDEATAKRDLAQAEDIVRSATEEDRQDKLDYQTQRRKEQELVRERQAIVNRLYRDH